MSQLSALLKNNLPFKRQARALKRALIPYRSNPENDDGLLSQSLRMVGALRDARAQLSGSTVVEIGSGWVPILSLVFRMAGAREVITIDQDRRMDRSTFIYAVNFVRENLQRVLTFTGVDPSFFDIRNLPSRQSPNLQALCQSAGITYVAPGDFLDLEPAVADFIVSRTVLEHIPGETLTHIFDHSAKVLKPGGMMCHVIDMSDHFSHKNKSLSRLDMLRYGDLEWRARSTECYQNRLRHFEFIDMLKGSGWDIVSANYKPDARAMEELKSMAITPRYAGVSHEELAVLNSLVVARR